jgi:glycerol kinase
VSKFLAVLAGAVKPLLDLINNILDPDKKRLRMIFALEGKIKDTEKLIEWLEKVIRKTQDYKVRAHYCDRLSIAVSALSRLRDDLRKLAR